MKTPLNSFIHITIFLLCFSHNALHAKETDVWAAPVPEHIDSLKSRLDNLESYTENVEYVLDHLEKNVVILQIIPLSTPHTQFKEISKYVQTAITESLNFTPKNYNYVLSRAANYFSEDGFIKFKDLVNSKSLFQHALDDNLTVQSVLLGRPVVSNAYVENRKFYSDRVRPLYTWEVELPLFIESDLGDAKQSTSKLIQVKVVRASIEHSPDQMIIDDIKIKDFNTGI